MSQLVRYAPGQPGAQPQWNMNAKSAVGTSLNPLNRVWFTIGRGIIQEVYHLSIDHACTRDMQLLVTDDRRFFSEEQRDTASELSYLTDGVPAFRLVNTCAEGRYRIEKEILTDPLRDVLLQRVRFVPLRNRLSDYHLYALLCPHLGNRGGDNIGFIGRYKGIPRLFAERDGDALAVACSAPWLKQSVGFVGISDGWQDIHRHGRMDWTYTRAEYGNIALTAQIDLNACDGRFILALGFGGSPAEAGNHARASLFRGFDAIKEQYIAEWRLWQDNLPLLDDLPDDSHLHRISAATLRIHEAQTSSGALISSLSIPWGFTRGDDNLGGYHLVWPRELVEVAGALLAIGAKEDFRRILHYLQSTQEAEGYWPQNMWPDGTSYWGGIQMDETAFPVVLLEIARREEALEPEDTKRFWPMAKKAAGFMVRNGPVSQRERWEDDPGCSPFALAAQIAALLAAADLADENNEGTVADYLRETADFWNANIEQWTYLKDTDLARQTGVQGYYARRAPFDEGEEFASAQGRVTGERPHSGQGEYPGVHIISPDFLSLVRFGLRMPDDQRIVNTLKLVDALLKVDVPQGPLWRRHTADTYGEYDDGRPFDGAGKGRLWPLLTGERAHYELAAGRRPEAERLLRTFAACANDGGLFPEQVWDKPDIPGKGLLFGKPTGSAIPLVWAHAEYLKLLRSLRDNSIFDLPPQTVQRYLIGRTDSRFHCWRKNHKARAMMQGKLLRIELREEATIHWSADNWDSVVDTPTRDTGLGVWVADLPTLPLPPDTTISFTFYWSKAGKWEGEDFRIKITGVSG